MGYATVADVQQLSGARTFTANSKVTASQVIDYLEQTAAVIDGILRGRGYSLPIATSATSTLKILELVNAQGAACLVEQGAPTSRPDGGGDSVCKMWAEAKKMLRDGVLELDAAIDTNEANPRSRGVATPFFTREMEL